jgi:NAD(P)-dependent dehydrogenase (short-subunit alcohol dehydrogenase family)
VVFITGAGQGLGAALLPALAEQGAVIAANDVTTINLDTPIQQIISAGGRAKAYDADVCKKLALQTMLNEIMEDFGQIDILINHASVQPRMSILEMDEWDWHRCLDVNLTATFLTTQSVGRIMKAQGSGKILNVGPVESGENINNRAAYLSSKAGIAAFTEVAAAELAEFNIAVNAIMPNKSTMQKNIAQALKLLQNEISGELVQIPPMT